MAIGIEKLVGMAEQIAQNISISEDDELVATELAAHLKKFWDPRMLAEFIAEAKSCGLVLSAPVAAAIDKLA